VYRAILNVSLAALILGAGPAVAETTFDFKGYIKMDALSTYYRSGDVAPESPLRDFHFPGAIPTGGTNENYDLDFHAKESRFAFETNTDVGDDRSVKAFLEFDFLLSPAGDERVSNSWNPRLRHVYMAYDNWLFGQTWSTFMVVLIPEDLDFAGAAEGIVFIRQPQIRYSWNKWQFAIENPETVVTGYQSGERISTESGRVPDLVARRNFSGDRGTLGVSAIARFLHYQDPGADINDQAFGFGFTGGGELKVGEKDAVKAQLTVGRGLGRYVGLNFVNSAVLDADDDLETIGQVAGFVDYRHWWTDKLRSSANLSLCFADNDAALTGPDVNQAAQSISVNLLYSPRPPLTFGVEYMHAQRELEGGSDGTMDRLQFSARYAFGYASPR
jgi:predicted porin